MEERHLRSDNIPNDVLNGNLGDTAAHLLIRELALECSYNTAGIREHICSDTGGEQPQAGILVYTVTADTDGTFGGLMNLGNSPYSRRERTVITLPPLVRVTRLPTIGIPRFSTTSGAMPVQSGVTRAPQAARARYPFPA